MTKRTSSSSFVPKKGKVRAVMKRSAIKKNALWKKLPYIRDADGMAPRGTRTDQMKWKRSLPELLQASDQSLVKKLIADKILPNPPQPQRQDLSEMQGRKVVRSHSISWILQTSMQQPGLPRTDQSTSSSSSFHRWNRQ